MAYYIRGYTSRINRLNDNVSDHMSKVNRVDSRTDVHSARIKELQNEIQSLKLENHALKNDVNNMKLDIHGNDVSTELPPQQEFGRRYAKEPGPYLDEKNPPSFFRGPPLTDRGDYDSRRIDERVRPPSPPLTDRNERIRGQEKKEMDRIEMHGGNFKPYSNNPLHPLKPRAQTGGGVYMFIRTSDDMFPTVKKAFQVHTGGLPERRLLGIATKECIRVMQNGEGWRRLKITATYKGNHYEEKSEPGEVTSNLSVMWFGSCNDAIEWYNRDFNFKTANFPPPNGSEISVLPLKYTLGWDPKAYYMLMQFTNVFDKRAVEYFVQEMVSELRNYRADAAFINGYPDKYHYKKSLHHYDKDHIVCHRFNNMPDAESFYHGFVGPNQQKLGNAAKLNSVIIFTLMDILGRR